MKVGLLLQTSVTLLKVSKFQKQIFLFSFEPEMLAETTESAPLCITDLFQNKSVAYF